MLLTAGKIREILKIVGVPALISMGVAVVIQLSAVADRPARTDGSEAGWVRHLRDVNELLVGLENITVNWRFRARAPWDPPSDPRLLLVAIDEISLAQFQGWPWPRTVHADFLRVMEPAEPAVLAFDILFTEAREGGGDQAMGEAAARMPALIFSAVANAEVEMAKGDGAHDPAEGPTRPLPNVVGDISYLEGAEIALLPIPPLRAVSRFGFVNSQPEHADGVRRVAPLVVRVGKEVYPSLSLQALLTYWKVPPENVRVVLGQWIEVAIPDQPTVYIPVDQRGRLYLNYRAKSSLCAVPYSELFRVTYGHLAFDEPLPELYTKNKIFPLSDKIMFVGQTAMGLSDLGPSPLDGVSPLVLTHLHAANCILRSDYITFPPAWVAVVVWFILMVMSVLVLLRIRNVIVASVLPLLFAFLYVVVAFAVFFVTSSLWPIFWPVFGFMALHGGWAFLRWRQERRSKQFFRTVFASYLSQGVLSELLRDPTNLRLGGVRKPVTILFSDIRGFTSISEGLGEEELVAQLNEYFEKMVTCVTHTRGTLHKYIGDAIMAVWGDVLSDGLEQDARNAVRAALQMIEELKQLNAMWSQQGRLPLAIGIGINHGPVLVGNIGASQRKEFTVMGDAVNLASRLESATKQFHATLLIGESVRHLLDNSFVVRTSGMVVVKGKTRPVRVYEVFGIGRAAGMAWAMRYEEAFNLFLVRQFEMARVGFEECLAERPDDHSAKLYRDTCVRFIAEPPPDDWNGVLVLKEK
jgi:adenylate cyclase